jgi:hypothetical protein
MQQPASMLSSMFQTATPRHVRLSTLLGLALVHAVVLTGFARLAVSPDRSQPMPSPAPLILRLLNLAQPIKVETPTPAVAPKTQTSTAGMATSPRAPTSAPTAAPTITTFPGAASALTEAITAPNPAPSAAPASSADAPLNLALPRAASAAWRQRPAAMDDPRANTAKATFESKLQAAMGGDGRWAEERIDGDRVRFRRGGTCVDFTRTRAEQLDSFNQSFSPKPWVTPGPKPC